MEAKIKVKGPGMKAKVKAGSLHQALAKLTLLKKKLTKEKTHA
jgi:hypothetical protein